MDTPRLDGIHHVKIPVSDLNRSRSWYETRLGYEVYLEFAEDGVVMGLAMRHGNGGPQLALRVDPERSAGLGDFDFLAIGVPDRPALEALADRLSGLGESHAGLHPATVGWILPLLHDPDGHEIRFYTTEEHTEVGTGEVLRVDHAAEEAARLAEQRQTTNA